MWIRHGLLRIWCGRTSLPPGLGANARVMPMDYLAFLQSTRETFDIALLDPPYAKGMIDQAAAAPGGEDVRIGRDRL